jgi:hypothetical protein
LIGVALRVTLHNEQARSPGREDRIVIGPGKLVTRRTGRRLKGWSGRRGARGCAVLLVCAGLALTLGVAALTASSGPSFSRAKSYATGSGPNSVAIGDLNGDGKLDLVTGNIGAYGEPEGSTVSVLLNRGDGSFEANRDYGTGAAPVSVAIGDLNGDGKLDLATANFDPDTVSVLLGRGDGSFQSKLDYRTGRDPSSIVIGDVNSDGQPDLATADIGADTVSVLLNRGGGGFVLNAHYQTGSGPFSVAIGDLNGDGMPDMAPANYPHASTVSVLLNAGDGSFLARRDYRAGSNPSSVAIGDLNGDGKPDLAAATTYPLALSVLLGRGDGTFAARREVTSPAGPIRQVAIGDMNRDHRPDLVTANTYGDRISGTSSVSVFVGRGNGRFQAPVQYPVDSAPYSMAIGDLNGDRRPDVATASDGQSTASVLLNRLGLCTVQPVRGLPLPAAKRALVRAHCRVGRIGRPHSGYTKGEVIAQKPRFGAVLPGGGKVNLVVSLGRRS